MTGDRSMAALLAELAVTLPEARATTSGGRTEWARAGVPFATLEGEAAELRLDPAIAAAAIRTSDATPSRRGTPWVRFAPSDLDDHAVDRATAWFGLAYRRSAGT